MNFEFAIILIGTITAILGQISGSIENKKISNWLKVIGIVLILMGGYFSFLDYQDREQEKLASSTSGVISSEIKYPCVIAGSNFIGIGPNGEVNLLKLIYLGSIFDPMLRLKMEDGYLKVSATVRDDDGRYLAGIVDNSWDTAVQPLILDKNFDKNAFEVVDSYKKVVLQVSLAGECANVSGVFYGPDGWATIITNDRITRTIPDKIYNMIEPNFIYPSEKHLGERIKR